MSAVGVRARTAPAGTAPAGTALAVVAAGSVVLLARPFAGVHADARAALFLVAYAAIALAAVSVRVGASVNVSDPPAPTSASRSLVVLATGLVALVLAVVAAGPPVPAPNAALAVGASVLAAVAEEALFRRVAYAHLARFGPATAIGATALLFALVHVPAYGTTALPVDVGAGVLFGWQRWASGSWVAPAATHAVANVLASMR